MSDDKKNKVSDKASEIARNIWLAGLGAYGKAFDEAQSKGETTGRETPPRLFKELVEKGSQLEGDARETLEELRDSHASAVEARIRKVRENFNLNKFSKDSKGEEIAELRTQVEELTATVEALTATVEKLKPARKTRK